MFTDTQTEELIDLLCDLGSDTKIYLGCDSVRFKKNGAWFAKYATVAVIHKFGRNGCRVFRHISVERDFDVKKNRPSIRLMNEVRKVAELYTQLGPLIDGFDVEIHCDVNLDPIHGSNCVADQAAGYILGVTGIEPKMKPNAWAASFCADWSAHRDPIEM